MTAILQEYRRQHGSDTVPGNPGSRRSVESRFLCNQEMLVSHDITVTVNINSRPMTCWLYPLLLAKLLVFSGSTSKTPSCHNYIAVVIVQVSVDRTVPAPIQQPYTGYWLFVPLPLTVSVHISLKSGSANKIITSAHKHELTPLSVMNLLIGLVVYLR